MPDLREEAREIAHAEADRAAGDERVSDICVGDSVHYHPLLGEAHNGKVYKVRAIGAIPSATGPVAWLEGKAGCVLMEALSKATETKE